MNTYLENVSDKWTNLENAIWKSLPKTIRVGEMPSFPLAHSIRMPKDIDFDIGSLALRLNNIQVASQHGFTPIFEKISIDEKKAQVCLRFENTSMSGEHALEVKQVWDAGIDGAGTGLSFDENGNVRRPGGADSNKNPTWVATAKQQRENLLNGPKNGMDLMDSYADHRVALNDAFTDPINYTFQVNWGVPAITDMAGHTNNCMTDTTKPINDAKKYDNQMTYNENALTQQLALGTVLKGMGTFTSDGKPDSNCPYQQAAKAVVNFNASVLSNTKSKKVKEIPAQTNESVYGIVKDGKPAQEVSLEQAHRYLDGEEIGGKLSDGGTWTMMLDEEDRQFLRDFKARHELHKERLMAVKPIEIVTGNTHTTLDKFYMYLEFSVENNNQLCFSKGRVELDSFDLELDDKEWPTDMAAIASEELSKARFIKSLVHDRVADALERDLLNSVVSILTKALDK